MAQSIGQNHGRLRLEKVSAIPNFEVNVILLHWPIFLPGQIYKNVNDFILISVPLLT